MNWQAVLDNPFLRDLPFKIELNRFGQIVMSPASNRRAAVQFDIGREIDAKMRSGRVLTECSIDTSDGVKVADIAWASDDFLERHGLVTPYPEAPEICVEIISPSNSRAEMRHKIDLYLAKGAREVWLCSEDGDISIFVHRGEVESSPLFGDKPTFRF